MRSAGDARGLVWKPPAAPLTRDVHSHDVERLFPSQQKSAACRAHLLCLFRVLLEQLVGDRFFE